MVARKSVPVVAEIGTKKVFVSALDWPGWSRSAKTLDAALEVLANYRLRYGAVTSAAGMSFPPTPTFEVVEQVAGDGTTDFGAPGKIASAEREALSQKEADRLAALVNGAWSVFGEIVARTPETLRKGPRGGGRDRDKMVAHVLEAEQSYARQLRVKFKVADYEDGDSVAGNRQLILDALGGTPAQDAPWPLRYAARRIAWHVLDHAWEMEDKSS